jgi:hypothetical protein
LGSGLRSRSARAAGRSGSTLTTTRPGGRSEAREIADAELAATLRDVFGLDLADDEDAALARAAAPAA